MPSDAPARLQWAIEVLEIAPDDQVLEIGCGHGVAASLVAERLGSGRLTAIDRSPRMIEAASARNQQHIQSGSVVFHTTSLAEATFSEARFTKIFAVNVNVFWMKPAAELAAVRNLVADEGMLYLFFNPPAGTSTQALADKLHDRLRAHGFGVERTLFAELGKDAGVCVIARPVP